MPLARMRGPRHFPCSAGLTPSNAMPSEFRQTQHRVNFVQRAAILLVLSGFLPGVASGQAAPPKPNVVLILADDLGWTDLACFGSELYETPHLDRLSQEGMRFTQNYSACTVCSPTRAALLTGKYPARLHITDWI